MFDSDDTIDGGDGLDTIDIDGENIDFSGLDDGQLLNIEVIDMSGEGDQTIELELQDVMDITDGDNDLTIEGDEGDVVELNSSEWSLGGHDVPSEDTGETYDVYTGIDDADVSLEIDTDVTVQFDE